MKKMRNSDISSSETWHFVPLIKMCFVVPNGFQKRESHLLVAFKKLPETVSFEGESETKKLELKNLFDDFSNN